MPFRKWSERKEKKKKKKKVRHGDVAGKRGRWDDSLIYWPSLIFPFFSWIRSVYRWQRGKGRKRRHRHQNPFDRKERREAVDPLGAGEGSDPPLLYHWWGGSTGGKKEGTMATRTSVSSENRKGNGGSSSSALVCSHRPPEERGKDSNDAEGRQRCRQWRRMQSIYYISQLGLWYAEGRKKRGESGHATLHPVPDEGGGDLPGARVLSCSSFLIGWVDETRKRGEEDCHNVGLKGGRGSERRILIGINLSRFILHPPPTTVRRRKKSRGAISARQLKKGRRKLIPWPHLGLILLMISIRGVGRNLWRRKKKMREHILAKA